VVGGRPIKGDVCVCVSIGRVASDCGPEIADAAFPMEVYLPIKEGSCTCSVLLKSSQLDTIQPIRGVV
jgi:hypothetical protein